MEPETGSPRVRGSQTVYLRRLSLPDLHSAWQPLLPHQTELPVYISGKQPQTHNATCYISCVAPAIIQPWVNILVNTNSPIVYWNGKYATSELKLLKNNYHLNLLAGVLHRNCYVHCESGWNGTEHCSTGTYRCSIWTNLRLTVPKSHRWPNTNCLCAVPPAALLNTQCLNNKSLLLPGF